MGIGKASKWIRNFLLGGKRDHEKDDEKKGVSSIVEETLGSPKEIISVTKEKRRWSFRKFPTTDKITHRNASFDSISTVKLVKQVLEEHEIEQIRIKAVFVKTSNEVDLGSEGLIATTPNSQLIESQLKDDAAIKIQSVFRSYLARKALRALRALVKLQALVRGHLVRKQTTTVLRCMHALMTIQVRARYKRVQMVEAEAENSMKRTSHGESTPDNLQSKIHSSVDKTTANVHEQRRSLKSKSGPLNHPKAERMEQGLISRSHSSRVDQHDTKCWNPSTVLTEIISSQKNVQNISDNESKTKRTEPPASTVPQPIDNPSYMSNTKSSKAKARSQSEPKQRPKWHQKQRSRQSTSTEGANVNPEGADQHTSCHLRLNEQENQQPWFVKLYRSAKPVKDGNVDSLIITTSQSNYGKSLNPFEVCSKPLANA